ncbi:hypothetical protein F5888DRAFT_1680126 [Russula emetica]|nr:hypothetical protein F5888DRAFT_1680126 [Russula emetica]
MVDFYLCLLMCPGIPQCLVCVRVLIPLHEALLQPAFPCIHSFQFPTPRFVCFMRSLSLLLPLLLVVGQILSLTLASPLASDGMYKRFCRFYACRVDGEPAGPPAVGTWTPVPYHPSTATAASTPTPVKQKLGADKQSTDSVLEPSPAVPFATESSSANAGVALASHGSGLAMALTGLLATVLAF